MKIFKQTLLAFLAIMCFVSCDKDDSELKNELETKASINAKWVVEGTSEFKSFEFNESGNYIIVKEGTVKSSASNSILFGTYEYDADQTITLSEFGTIKISDYGTDHMNFVVELKDGTEEPVSLKATKKEEMGSSERTDLLCRSWKLIRINDVNVEGTEEEITVLFSKAGTYFVEFVNPNPDVLGGLAEWSWSNSSKTAINYSWTQYGEGGTFDIVELTDNSLKILEEFEGEESEMSTLVPLNN